MKKQTKLLLTALAVALLVLTMAVCVFAEESGWVKNTAGTETNIKWTVKEVDGEKVAFFDIVEGAPGKTATTILYGTDPVTGKVGQYSYKIENGWGINAGITRAEVGEGITAIVGGLFAWNSTLKTVVIPSTLVELKDHVFAYNAALKTVHIRGTEFKENVMDISCVTKISAENFDGIAYAEKVILNPNYVGAFPAAFMKNMQYLQHFELPAGVTTVANESFYGFRGFKTLTVLGMDTEFESIDVFKDNQYTARAIPNFIGYVGSKAEEFCKENNITFIDIETGETVFKGTNMQGKNPEAWDIEPAREFKPLAAEIDVSDATMSGFYEGHYNGTKIINTTWAWYESTKTLKFFGRQKSFTETGSVAYIPEGEPTWDTVRTEVEHIILDEYISCISHSAFKGMTNLKDIMYGSAFYQLNPFAIAECPNLTTIWYDRNERIEGLADLTGDLSDNFTKNNLLAGTAIKEVKLSSKASEEVPLYALDKTIETIHVRRVTDKWVEYGKTNYINIRDWKDPSVAYDFHVEIPEDLPYCGERAVFEFDEATGTLTVKGAGAIDDIISYYGGGSKRSPWFEIKMQIKHVIIESGITYIGKYSFTECENLETVQIPAREDFLIGNAAFEKCYNLKSIYREGTQPVLGTLDLANVKELPAWTFAYNYLIANVVINSEVTKIGSSTFEECANIQNIYGTPGSYAETYATENGYAFNDVASAKPQPIECTPPETTVEGGEETTAPVTTEPVTTAPVTTVAPETTAAPETTPAIVTTDAPAATTDGGDSTMIIIIAAAAAAVIIIAVVVVVIAKKKKK